MRIPPASALNSQSRTRLLVTLAFTAFIGLVIMTASLLLESKATVLLSLIHI